VRLLTDAAVRATSQDRFDNQLYADLLRDVIDSTPPGTAIGLFGKWGQGKTSVINMLAAVPPKDTEIAVFNAWRSRGDTVRRQLLLHVLKEIDSPKYDEISRFVQPGIPLKIRTLMEQESVRESRLWWILTTKESLDLVAGAALLLGAGSVVAFVHQFLTAMRSPDPHELTMWSLASLVTLTVSCMTVVFRWFHNRKQLLLTSAEPVSDSQRLKYPEQFQRVFEQEVSAFCQHGRKLVVVIDDLDRCEPNTVVEALSSIRQFSGAPAFIENQLNCQFIVPCDEKQVVLALESAGHDLGEDGARCHDYRNEELLRKFFDVVIRMDAPLHQDMIAFAEKLVTEERLDLTAEEARELVALASARDPREVKKLLNALVVSKAKRERSGELLPSPESLDQLGETERFLVVLREKAPLAFDLLGQNPLLLEKGFPAEETEDEWRTEQYAKANQLLEVSPPLSVPTATVLTFGRLDPELREVKGAGLLIHAIADDRPGALDRVMGQVAPAQLASVRSWLMRKCRELRTVPEARRMLLHLLDYGLVNDNDELSFVEPCLRSLTESSVDLVKVMDEFGHCAELEVELPEMDRSIAAGILAAAWEASADGSHRDEEGLELLLRLAKLCAPQTRARMSDWMASEVESGGNAVQFAVRLARKLDVEAEPKYLFGAFPAVAQKLAAIKDWQLGSDALAKQSPSRNPIGRLIVLFAGDDESACSSCLDWILGDEGICASVEAYAAEDRSKARELWGTIGALLLNEGDVSGEHASAAVDWVAVQNEPQIARVLLEAVWPSVHRFPPLHQSRFIEQAFIAHCFEEDVSTDGLDIPEYSEEDASAEPPGTWHTFLQMLMTKVKRNTGLVSQELRPNSVAILQALASGGWRFPDIVDTVLARITANGHDWPKWSGVLIPLGERYPKTEEAICRNLRQGSNTSASIRLGLRTVWKQTITVNSGNALGHALIEHFQDGGREDPWREVFARKRSERVIEAAVSQLKEPDHYGTEWLHNHKALLLFIADRMQEGGMTAPVPDFCETLKRLTYSPDQNYAHTAATVVARLPVVSAQLRRKLSEIRRENRAGWKSAGHTQRLQDFKNACAVTEIKGRSQ